MREDVTPLGGYFDDTWKASVDVKGGAEWSILPEYPGDIFRLNLALGLISGHPKKWIKPASFEIYNLSIS